MARSAMMSVVVAGLGLMGQLSHAQVRAMALLQTCLPARGHGLDSMYDPAVPPCKACVSNGAQ